MTELSEIAALIRRESGIVIAPAQFRSLSAAIERVGRGRSLDGLDTELDGDLVERLIDEVAIKETFFFRHERELATIDWRTLMDGARQAGRSGLRVWSAACASGEEAYTLAILACEAFGTAAPPVSILGTDLSPSALERARGGKYSVRAVREAIPGHRERWLRSDRDGLAVAPELRKLVTLRRHNLVRDPIPPPGEGKFDVVVCRNVLIYFDRPTIGWTLSGLERALYPQGALVIGAADRLSGAGAWSSPQRPRPRVPRGSVRRPRRSGRAQAAERRRSRSDSPRSGVPPEDLLRARGEWSVEETLERTGALLELDPLSVDAYFMRGVAQLAAQNPADAVGSLRRALYLEPDFGLAAFKLARAYEALHDTDAARRAYVRALYSLNPDDPRSAALIHQLDVADIAAACRTRLAALDAG